MDIVPGEAASRLIRAIVAGRRARTIARRHQRRPGTAPRSKTVRRLQLQGAAGWPTTSKLVATAFGYMHPTKGLRRYSPGRAIPLDPGMRRVAPVREPRSELQAAVAA